MKRNTKHLIAAIAADDPKEFERQFNEQMSLLSDNNPQVTLDISNGFRAVIQYEVEERAVETVKDEFHAEGLRFLCMHCPHYEDPGNKTVKHVACKYADLGRTHLEHEACEVFYKQVKNGTVQPKEDLIPLRKMKVPHGTGWRWV